MKKHLLDTDILSAFFRNRRQVVNQIANYLDEHDRLSITIITYYEVLRGLRYVNATRQLHDLENFVADNEVLPLDTQSVKRAAEVYAILRQQGQLISEGDLLIAGIALANNCVLVTNNISHFERIPNLEVENWLQ